MYDLIDRPIAMLPTFEREILDATRRWVHAFTHAGAEGAGADRPLDHVMHALDRGSTDDIVIQRPCFATVDESEAVILSLWRLVRDAGDQRASAVASALVGQDHVAPLLDGMARVLRTL